MPLTAVSAQLDVFCFFFRGRAAQVPNTWTALKSDSAFHLVLQKSIVPLTSVVWMFHLCWMSGHIPQWWPFVVGSENSAARWKCQLSHEREKKKTNSLSCVSAVTRWFVLSEVHESSTMIPSIWKLLTTYAPHISLTRTKTTAVITKREKKGPGLCETTSSPKISCWFYVFYENQQHQGLLQYVVWCTVFGTFSFFFGYEEAVTVSLNLYLTADVTPWEPVFFFLPLSWREKKKITLWTTTVRPQCHL